MEDGKLESIYTGTEGRLLRTVPPGPAVEGKEKWQRLLAVAEWSPEDKEENLTIYNIEIQSQGRLTAPSNCSIMRRFHLQGSTTAMQVADVGQGEILLVAGSSRGQLYSLRFRLPLSPDIQSEDIQWLGLEDEEELTTWQQPHKGEVSGLDISRDTHQIVTVGRDGAICLVSPSTSDTPELVKAARMTASYNAVKWASTTTFVTAGTTGGLEVWDKRRGSGNPASRSPLEWGYTGCPSLDAKQGFNRQITALDIHPSRPHLCATGSAAATVTIWDLRFQAQPLTRDAGHLASGDVTELHFDAFEADSATVTTPIPSVLVATNGGHLFSFEADNNSKVADVNASPHPSQGNFKLLLTSVAGGVRSFGTDPHNGQDLFCLGDSECLIYAHRA